MILFYFLGFSGSVPLDFFAVLHFPYHAGMEFLFFALCFSSKFFSIHFFHVFFPVGWSLLLLRSS